jgi:enterobactin synthetase component D
MPFGKPRQARAIMTPTERRIPGLSDVRRHIQRIGKDTFPVHLVAFDSEHFTSCAYLQAGIIIPATIRRSVHKRQAEFFFGRLAASHALAEFGLHDCQVGQGNARQPVFPPYVHGTITHTGGLAAAAVLRTTDWQGVGIDIEYPIPPDALGDVEQIVLDEKERKLLRACTALPYSVLATLAFSAKESFYKAVFAHVGRVFDYRALHLQAIDDIDCRLHFTTTEHLAFHWPSGKSCAADFTILQENAVLTVVAW